MHSWLRPGSSFLRSAPQFYNRLLAPIIIVAVIIGESGYPPSSLAAEAVTLLAPVLPFAALVSICDALVLLRCVPFLGAHLRPGGSLLSDEPVKCLQNTFSD